MSKSIGFGYELGINPADIGIEEFRYFSISSDPRINGSFIIKYRDTKTSRVTSLTVDPNSLIKLGIINLEKLSNFLK